MWVATIPLPGCWHSMHIRHSWMDVNSQKIHLVCCTGQRYGRGEHIQVAAKESQHEYGYYQYETNNQLS